MNIIVLVKMVASNALGKAEPGNFAVNPYDKFAIEQAVTLKKIHDSDYKITCICMGSLALKEKIKDCFLYGADDVILLSDERFSGADTLATSYVLCQAIERLFKYDLILCGNKSVDAETGQVGPGVAARLDIPYITNVDMIEELNNREVICIRETEEKTIRIKCRLPMLIAYKDFSTDMVTVSLHVLRKAKNKTVRIVNLDDLNLNSELCGIKGSKTKVISTNKIQTIPKCVQVIEGTIEEKSKHIMKILRQR